jgi:hypothetical protein
MFGSCSSGGLARRYIPVAKVMALAAAVLIAIAAPAQAAAIYVTWTITHPVIHLVGEIRPGDDQVFASVTKGLQMNSAVSLNSPGGEVEPAIEIGRLVRERGFSTFVSNPPHYCNSACGMILMSGAHVVIEAKAYVGFHAGNTPQATAMVADYYRELGLTDQQIAFMIAAPFGGKPLYATLGRARALGFQWATVLAPLGVSQCQASGSKYCWAFP